MSSSGASTSSTHPSSLRNRPIDPITRTALRYTISPREYELLHQYVISRAPKNVQRHTPDPARYERIVSSNSSSSNNHSSQRSSSTTTDNEDSHNASSFSSAAGAAASSGHNDGNVSAMRAALRVFVAVYIGMKSYDKLTQTLAARRGKKPSSATATTGTTAVRYKNARIALSFSSILLFHRLLQRFLTRLRGLLLEENARPFRKRNPGIARLLTSPFTPAVGAAMAGSLLVVAPADQMRMSIAIYVLVRGLEFGYNALEESGTLWGSKKVSKSEDGSSSPASAGSSGRPWWFGSWMLMPFVCGQLLHAFVFDRDCFPEDYGSFILKRSPEYIQLRPRNYQGKQPWPGTFDIVDALAELSRLKWPAFTSPILFPGAATATAAVNQTKTAVGRSHHSPSSSLSRITPITSPANPAIRHTSCAILHPHDPSCARTYARYFSSAFPQTLRFFSLIYGAFALLAYKSLLKSPLPFLNALSSRILRMTLFITGAIGTSWASICASNALLPGKVLSTQRWFLGGFAGGLWAFVARGKERGNFLYSLRLSIDSCYKVGKKRGWWKGVRNGDVAVFVAGLVLLELVYEAKPDAVRGAALRKVFALARGEGWVDRVVVRQGKKAEKGGVVVGEKKAEEVVKEEVERREEQEEALGDSLVDVEEAKEE